MDAHQRLIQAVGSKWRWAAACWFQRENVMDALNELCIYRKQAEALSAKLADKESEYRTARDGNVAMAKFIQTRHQLNLKLNPDKTVRLRKGNENEKADRSMVNAAASAGNGRSTSGPLPA